jgi:hypothetical protein
MLWPNSPRQCCDVGLRDHGWMRVSPSAVAGSSSQRLPAAAVAYADRRPTRSPDAGENARAPRRCPANPRLGDALVPERGARRATGSRGIRQPPANTLPGCGRGRPRSQEVPRQSQTWRGAVAYVNRRPTRSPDAGGDARAPRRCPANPRLGDALVPERGARRATRDHACHQPPRNPTPCGRGRPRSQGGTSPRLGTQVDEPSIPAVRPVCRLGTLKGWKTAEAGGTPALRGARPRTCGPCGPSWSPGIGGCLRRLP